uniref:Ig-like domain-containing protein n=1 Tax=Pygocentrus nattereri TaxID=42514 RepID=A0AAR2JHX8_PYGNA
ISLCQGAKFFFSFLVCSIAKTLSNKAVQTPPDLTKNVGDTVVFYCEHNISGYDRMLWYKQSNSETTALALISYTVGKGSLNNEDRFQERFTLNRQTTVEDLSISELQQSDSAVYYCGVSKQTAAHSYECRTKRPNI